MSKESSPAFQFYAADYLADEKVQLMTVEEEGVYIRLMAYCWREGSIPSDPEKLEVLAKGSQCYRSVIALFDYPCSDTSRLMHPRLEVERQKQAENRKKKSDAGTKGNINRWKSKHSGRIAARSQRDDFANRKTIANDRSSSSISSSYALTPELPPNPPRGNGSELAELFILFWQNYPRHEGRQPAWRAFQKINPSRDLIDLWIPWLTAAKKSNQWQERDKIPFPATWLNQKRWEDDPPPHKETSSEEIARISRELESEGKI